MSERVFVTGVTGYLGAAISRRLKAAGYEVWGLTRSEERAAQLEAAGFHAVVGDVSEPATFRGALNNSDAVVHAAAEHGPHAAKRDQQALHVIRAAVEDGRVRRVLYTSGIWVHGDTGGRVVDETARPEPLELVAWRPAHEEVVLDLATLEAAAIVLRPGMVYGGSRGVFGGWFREARQHGTVHYPGGAQHWSAVHLDDVADAYRLALAHAEPGTRYLLTDDSRHTVKDLAEAAAAAAGARAVAEPADQVLQRLGAFGAALLTDSLVSSARARRELGWAPRHASFVRSATTLWDEWLSGERAPVG
ncbi:MAG: NAD-dependent epimerase/dehydratase family protein [Candidatus Eisenbacteria bacterium]|uniref:NAD-dependent epimerase/dehydratase family protein n=1 Tax=Eiseniibacteriota bacterium TaxID=2212470 RepID=A0A849SRH5_UNCEI|nr:NAD-dependent epimerase/dehydratase family protein [Candidatus Eisenbacteria bacterium]